MYLSVCKILNKIFLFKLWDWCNVDVMFVVIYVSELVKVLNCFNVREIYFCWRIFFNCFNKCNCIY